MEPFGNCSSTFFYILNDVKMTFAKLSHGSCDLLFQRHPGRLMLASLPLYNASCSCVNHSNNSLQSLSNEEGVCETKLRS